MKEPSNIKKKVVPFTMIQTDFLSFSKISLKAKGLLSYLYSKPPGWNFSSVRVAKELLESESTILSYLKELEKWNRLKRTKLKNGRMIYELSFDEITNTEELGIGSKANPQESQTGNVNDISNNEKESKNNLNCIPSTSVEVSDSSDAGVKPAKVKYSKKDKKIAAKHFKAVKKSFPNTTVKYNASDWADTIRKLVNLNKFNYKEIKAALKWGLQDSFWKNKIHSIPALRNRAKNGKLKFENLLDSMDSGEPRTFTTLEKEPFDPEKEFMDNNIGNRCKRISNAISNNLTNTFYECSAMSSELIDLVEKISCLCENDLILWKQYKSNVVFGVNPYDRMLEFALPLEAIYPYYCKKYHQVPDAVRTSNDKDLKYVGFSKIKYGSDCWIDFEKYITDNQTRVIESEALELLGTTRKKYLKGNKDNAFGDILK